MHDVLRERLWRHLEALPEERIYQVLDYIEFLTSKYAAEAVRPPASGLQRFGERLEDRLRRNGVGFGAIRGTLEVMGTADRVMSGLTEAGRSLMREVGAAGERLVSDPPATPEPRAPERPRPDFPVDDSGADEAP